MIYARTTMFVCLFVILRRSLYTFSLYLNMLLMMMMILLLDTSTVCVRMPSHLVRHSMPCPNSSTLAKWFLDNISFVFILSRKID